MKVLLKKFIPGIAWFFVVLYIMCLPGSDIPSVGWLNMIYFDKWVHVSVFTLLGVLFCWPFYRSHFNKKQRIWYFLKIAIAVSIWGLTIEFIQKFWIAGRSFDLLDWAADSLGALIAYYFSAWKFAK